MERKSSSQTMLVFKKNCIGKKNDCLCLFDAKTMKSCEEKEDAKADEGCLRIKSPYRNNTNLFNNKSMFPDLELVVAGFGKPLLLHKGIMANTSKLMEGLLNAKHAANCATTNQVEWMFDTSNDVDREALVKVLRFCYDDALTVDAKELCAVIAAVCRLQVSCLEKVLAKLTKFAVEQAKNDVRVGTELLKETQRYPECHSPSTCELDKKLAEVVLTGKNISENYDFVVNDCLMQLPAQYLDITEYGDPHTQFSEFNVRVQYVKEHSDELKTNEKEALVLKCDWTQFNSKELKELRGLGFVRQELMTELCDRVLENIEKESESLVVFPPPWI